MFWSSGQNDMMEETGVIIIQETYAFCCKDPRKKSTYFVNNPLWMCKQVWLSFSSAGNPQQLLLWGLCSGLPGLEEPHKGRGILKARLEEFQENLLASTAVKSIWAPIPLVSFPCAPDRDSGINQKTPVWYACHAGGKDTSLLYCSLVFSAK